MEEIENIEIPIEQISKEALNGAIEEFILRENAESGHSEADLSKQVDKVFKLLNKGRAKLVFDMASRTHSILKCD